MESKAIQQVIALFCYLVSTILTNTIIKKTSITYNLPFMFLGVQASILSITPYVVYYLGLSTMRPSALTFQLRKKLFFISIMLFGIRFTTYKCLGFLPICQYSVVKGMSLFILAFCDYFISKERLTMITTTGIISIIFSAILLVKNSDAAPFTVEAIFFCCLNCFFSTSNIVGSRILIHKDKVDWQTYMYHINIPVAIVSIVSTFFFDGYQELLASIEERQSVLPFLFIILTSSLCGLSISYWSIQCISLCSSLTYGITGILSKLPLTILATVVFPSDGYITYQDGLSLFFSIVGGCMYTYGKITGEKAKMLKNRKDNLV